MSKVEPRRLDAWLERDAVVAVSVYGGLAVLVTALVVIFEGSAEQSLALQGRTGIPGLTWMEHHNPWIWCALSGLAALGIAVSVAWRLADGPAAGARVGRLALIGLVLTSGFSALYGATGIARTHYVSSWDVFHQVLGAKYFDELGYFGLYDCVAAADTVTLGALERAWVRDLRAYPIRLSRAEAAARCGDRFGPARWEAFTRDYEELAQLGGPQLQAMVGDRGYNGTPTHASISRLLLSALPRGYRGWSLAALVDPLALLAMCGALSLAFGWQPVALVAVLFFTLFCDPHLFVHGSILRYTWMVGPGFAAADLARGRHLGAGLWLGAAGALALMPLLFAVGVVLRALWVWVDTRAPAPGFARFAAGLVAGGLALGAVGAGGLDGYRGLYANMRQHVGSDTVSATGLRYAVVAPGLIGKGAYLTKVNRVRVQRTRKWAVLAAAGLTLALLVGCRRLDDAEASVLGGVVCLFAWSASGSYYSSVFALLLLVGARGPPLRALSALPFLLNSGVVLLFEAFGPDAELSARTWAAIGKTNNYSMSLSLLLLLLVWLGSVLWRGNE